MNHLRIVAIIPAYNNVRTVRGVIEGVRAHLPDVIAVDDGSTDGTGNALDAIVGIEIITVEKKPRQGKRLTARVRPRNRARIHSCGYH